MTASPVHLLRLLRRTQPATEEPVRVLGVDDWAKRKGKSYGTILVDLERHGLTDLLDGRTSEDLAAWLRAHPGIEVFIGIAPRSMPKAGGTVRPMPPKSLIAGIFSPISAMSWISETTSWSRPSSCPYALWPKMIYVPWPKTTCVLSAVN